MSFTQHSTRRTTTLALGALLAGLAGLALFANPAHARIEVETEEPAEESGEVEGVVGETSGTCPNLTFEVLGTRITTNQATEFEDGTCADLREGAKVEVKVPLQATDGIYDATKVEFSTEE